MAARRRTAAASPSASRAVLTYNVLRLLLLAACLGIGFLLRLPGLWLIVSALIVSGVLSFFLLRRQRIAMGLAVEQTVDRARELMAERTAAEDAYVDALAAQQSGSAEDGDDDRSRDRQA